MTPDAIKQALLESYARDGGINHLDGVNLPSQDRVADLARDFMHVLFPGYFESTSLAKSDVPAWLDRVLAKLDERLGTEIEKSLLFAKDAAAAASARRITTALLTQLPDIRRVVQTDVQAAYTGDLSCRACLPNTATSAPALTSTRARRLARTSSSTTASASSSARPPPSATT
jgi:serine O-acetyltransferase